MTILDDLTPAPTLYVPRNGKRVDPSHYVDIWRWRRLVHAISLGCGVQSSTMLFMAARGLIRPMPTAALFADTRQEPGSVYRWLKYLQSCELPFPIIVRSKGDLGADNLKVYRSKNTGKKYVRSMIPTYMLNPDGTGGILQRRCTQDYKVKVIISTYRNEVLKRRSIRATSPVLGCSWIGISTDEADRMKPSKVPWLENRWPLIELGMTREDCKVWMRKNGFPDPPRSACRQCVYHSNREWLRLKTEEPDEFALAVNWERDYQQILVEHDEITTGVPFLHNSLVNIDQIDFQALIDKKKDINHFSNECEGMCGV